MIVLPDGQIFSTAPVKQLHAAPSPPAVRRLSPTGTTGRILPNWLQAYADFSADSEAPPVYNVWVALSTLAGASQRNIYMQESHRQTMTNMFVVLTGPAGTGKSSAMRIGKALLSRVPKVFFAPNSATPSSLIKAFISLPDQLPHQSLTLVGSELSSFLNMGKLEMIDLLTDLFDGEADWEKQTRAHGAEKLKNPWLNIVCGTTPTWIGDNMNRTMATGGFAARTLFVYSDQIVLKDPFPSMSPGQLKLRDALINDLTSISELRGVVKFSKAAIDIFTPWYLDSTRLSIPNSETLSTYLTRKPLHVKKLAMVLSLARDNSLVVEAQDVHDAWAMLASIEPGMKRTLSAVGGNQQATVIERMLQFVIDNGKVSSQELMAQFYNEGDIRVMKMNVEQLEAMGALKKVWTDKGAFYTAG